MLRTRVNNDQDRYDLAAALQAATEVRLIDFLGRFIGDEETDLCLSGGFFLNCQVAGKIKSWFPQVRRVYIPPAPYDGGISVGAAQLVYHAELGLPGLASFGLVRSQTASRVSQRRWIR